MFGFSLNQNINEYIRETAQVQQFGAKVREANMVQTYVEDRQWICWTKDFEDREEQAKEEGKKKKESGTRLSLCLVNVL